MAVPAGSLTFTALILKLPLNLRLAKASSIMYERGSYDVV